MEELEDRCLAIHAVEAKMPPRRADAVEGAAQLLEDDFRPFERFSGFVMSRASLACKPGCRRRRFWVSRD